MPKLRPAILAAACLLTALTAQSQTQEEAGREIVRRTMLERLHHNVETWAAQESTAAPPEHKTGNLRTVPYGYGTVIMLCSPLRVCTIQTLEPITAAAVGDGHRWRIERLETRPRILTVKPTACGVSTNLFVAAGDRTYDIDLRSYDCAPGSEPDFPWQHISYYDPDRMVQAWTTAAQKAEREPVPPPPIASFDPTTLDLSYEVRRNRAARRAGWTIEALFSDDRKTYIRFSSPDGETPILRSGGDVLEVRIDRGLWIVDQPLEAGELFAGTSRSAPRLTFQKVSS